MKRPFVFAAALFALAACASDSEEAAPIEIGGGALAAPAPTDCFDVDRINGFTGVDRDTVRVTVGASRTYEIDAGGAACSNLQFANQIAITNAGVSRLCAADTLYTARLRTDQGDDCQIENVRAIVEPAPTPAPADAAPTQ